MAIAFDAKSALGAFSASSPVTWSHTCTGSDRILFVIAYATGGDNFTSGTYNSVALTEIAKVDRGDGRYINLLYLINPASGSNTVSLSYGGAGLYHGIASSYTGAKQSGVPDASVTNTAADTSVTGTVTTVADNTWLVGCYSSSTGGTISAGANTLLRQGATNSGPDTYLIDSNSLQTPAGSKSMTCNVTSPGLDLGIVVASFAPAVAAVTFTPKVMMF